jgi:hypothetical protein
VSLSDVTVTHCYEIIARFKASSAPVNSEQDKHPNSFIEKQSFLSISLYILRAHCRISGEVLGCLWLISPSFYLC